VDPVGLKDFQGAIVAFEGDAKMENTLRGLQDRHNTRVDLPQATGFIEGVQGNLENTLF
jgi:hypothetical protein